MTSLCIRNATVFDGTGSEPFSSDVRVTDGLISGIGLDLDTDRGVVEANGLCLAPGFIDVHTHDDIALITDPECTSKLSQGVTTIVTGLCGYSPAPLPVDGKLPEEFDILIPSGEFRFGSFKSFLATVAGARPRVNYLPLVGHSALRLCHMEQFDRSATSSEIDAMCSSLRAALSQGAMGLSSGLAYRMAKEADIVELDALASVLAEFNSYYVTHIRNEGDEVIEAVQEALDLGKRAGILTILSHHKMMGCANHGKSRHTLAMIDAARQDQSLGLDVYPYTFASTVLDTERAAKCDRILITRSDPYPEHIGRDLNEIAALLGLDRQTTVERLMPGGAIYFAMSDDDLDRIISYDLTMIGSDGLPYDDWPHPRLWGTFPRILGHYVRERNLLSWEEAIYRMTGLPARTFGLADRGIIRVGAIADLVLFDRDSIEDLATVDGPKQPAKGIKQVWVGGVEASKASGQRLSSSFVYNPSPASTA